MAPRLGAPTSGRHRGATAPRNRSSSHAPTVPPRDLGPALRTTRSRTFSAPIDTHVSFARVGRVRRPFLGEGCGVSWPSRATMPTGGRRSEVASERLPLAGIAPRRGAKPPSSSGKNCGRPNRARDAGRRRGCRRTWWGGGARYSRSHGVALWGRISRFRAMPTGGRRSERPRWSSIRVSRSWRDCIFTATELRDFPRRLFPDPIG